ncbi:hypothetical protein C0989_004715 [Termitomyces sp. Mn162]|nr:hypothetical protein C0989_004715 [Termitomyces sp. Mn162]
MLGARKTRGVTTHNASTEQETQAKSPSVNNMSEAKYWLSANGHLDNISNKMKADSLKNVLLQLLRRTDTPMDIRDGMRAVAFGMEDIVVGEAEKVVMEAVGKVMEECREVLENLAEVSMKSLKGMAEQAREGREGLEEGQVMEMRVSQGGANEGGGGWQWRMAREGALYADAARRAEREDMVQKARNKTRQVIIDNAQGAGGWKELTEKELIEKAQITKDMMGIQGLDSPKVDIITAWKLKNRGVLYKLKSTKAAEWLMKEEV